MRTPGFVRGRSLGRVVAAIILLVGLFGATVTLALPAPQSPTTQLRGPLRADQPIRGWTILSDVETEAQAVISAAPGYRINDLQLSHLLVNDLREIREPERRAKVLRLIDAGHGAGIQEVVLWDHALYDLDYYPARFRTGPGGTIDLDNTAFWEARAKEAATAAGMAPASAKAIRMRSTTSLFPRRGSAQLGLQRAGRGGRPAADRRAGREAADQRQALTAAADYDDRAAGGAAPTQLLAHVG